MQILTVSVLVVLILFENSASGVSFWKSLLKSESHKIVQNNQQRDYTSPELESYLQNLLNKEELGQNVVLSFPRSLSHPKYRLFDGKVTRFYESLRPYGFYDNIIFHRSGESFFGALQVYAPQIDFTFRYETNIDGTRQTGSFSIIVTHDPIHLQIEFGITDGRVCRIIRDSNSGEFFFERNLNASPKYQPDSPSGQRAAETLTKEILNTWVPDFYQVVLNAQVEKMVREAKQKMLTDRTAGYAYKRFCQQTVSA